MCQYMCPIDRPSFLSPVGSAVQAVPRRTRPSVEAPFTGTDELQRLVGMAQAELRKRGPPTTTGRWVFSMVVLKEVKRQT